MRSRCMQASFQFNYQKAWQDSSMAQAPAPYLQTSDSQESYSGEISSLHPQCVLQLFRPPLARRKPHIPYVSKGMELDGIEATAAHHPEY